MACKTFKIYKGCLAPLLSKLISKSRCAKQFRNKYKINKEIFKYAVFKRSFALRATKIWNNESRKMNSYNSFKANTSNSDYLNETIFDRTQHLEP